MYRLFVGDDPYNVKMTGKSFAHLLDLQADDKTAIRYNRVVPTDELTPIKGLDLFNMYIAQSQKGTAKYGVQVKVVDIC